jgi:hypothetical protein
MITWKGFVEGAVKVTTLLVVCNHSLHRPDPARLILPARLHAGNGACQSIPVSPHERWGEQPHSLWGEQPHSLWGEQPHSLWGEQPHSLWGEQPRCNDYRLCVSVEAPPQKGWRGRGSRRSRRYPLWISVDKLIAAGLRWRTRSAYALGATGNVSGG